MLAQCHSRGIVVLLSLIASQACSGNESGNGALSVGGAPGVGGGAPGGGAGSGGAVGSSTGQGGTAGATGGSLGLGGALSTGGSLGAGGTSNTSVAPTGGAKNTGGVAAVGGTPNTGGSTSNSTRTGGAPATGGSSTGGGAKTGGAPATGGSSTSGGAKTGGAPATGGSSITSTGGAAATGGVKTTGGATGTGGASSAGTPICGTGAEGAKVTLTCPTGQIISAVQFASYGSPTGTCGNFATGSCNAISSQGVVNSICVGRNSCTVPATNAVFSDPCNSSAKSLNVQVTCAAGTPIIQPTSPYKGLANSPAGEITNLKATWCYNWTTNPDTANCANPLFVPMVWGGGNVANAIQAIGNAGFKTALGFNEPNKTDQANMTVAAAIALWPTLTSNPNIRVSSPAVSDDGRAWLVDFMTQARQRGLRVDFIAMHWYGWNAGSCVASQLEGAVNWAQQWGLPVWITEFGCMGSSNSDEPTVINFYNNAVTMLKNHPLVERYAWYPWNTYNDLYRPNASNVRVITTLGTAFAAAAQYHP